MELVASSSALSFVTSHLQSCGVLSVFALGTATGGIMAFYIGKWIAYAIEFAALTPSE
jgi:ABC-type dipeptide/oligopeptide/nickel transport system permease component